MSHFGLALSSGPAAEPLSLTDAKAHLRVNIVADDALIEALVKSARKNIEDILRRQLITATWVLTLDSFPAVIKVPRPPLQSVTTLKYVDEDGNQQTLDSPKYSVDAAGYIGRIAPAYNESWPSTRDQMAAIEVTYVAGFGATASDVPESLVQALKMILAHWYENRESVVVGVSVADMPLAFESLINPYRVFERK